MAGTAKTVGVMQERTAMINLKEMSVHQPLLKELQADGSLSD
jgi:hypothetical protein